MNSGSQAQAAGYLLKNAQQALRSAMDSGLRDVGITTPQYAVLAFLDESPGLSSAELARKAFVTPQTMNRIVTNLEMAGLIERDPHPESGRVLSTRLSIRGRNLLAESHRRVGQVEERMVGGLTVAERRQLGDLLDRCAKALRPERHARATLRPLRAPAPR